MDTIYTHPTYSIQVQNYMELGWVPYHSDDNGMVLIREDSRGYITARTHISRRTGKVTDHS